LSWLSDNPLHSHRQLRKKWTTRANRYLSMEPAFTVDIAQALLNQ